MRNNFTKLLTFGLLSVGLANAFAQSQIPMRDFFKNPEQTNFQISDNNLYMAFLKPWNSRLNVFIQKLSNDRLPIGEPKQVTFIGERSVSALLWKGDSTIVYSRDFGGDEDFKIFSVDIGTGEEKALTPFPGARNNILDDLRHVSETEILIESNKRDKAAFDVYRLNVNSGEMQMIAQNNGQILEWLADNNGTLRMAVACDGLTTRVSSRESDSDEFKEILNFAYDNKLDLLNFDASNNFIYAASNLGRDKQTIVLIDARTGKEIKTIFEHPEVDVEDIRFSQKRKEIQAAVYTTWRQNYHYFDQKAAERHGKIKAQLGDVQIFTNSANKNEDLFTYIITDDKGRSVYLYDDKNGKSTLLYDTTTYLPRNKLADVRPIQFKSRDGLTIHGYLTLPNNSSGKNLPVIVHPHGGPNNVRDLWGYNSTVQFLANRGYAVVQINYRGSSGYGKDFYKKSFRQWGRTMQNDLTDGVQYLIDKGIADPSKVAIYGASYGGYAALAGAAFTPDLYACAIDVVGPSNLFTLLETIPAYWAPFKPIMYERIGDPVKDKELLMAISPVFHADKIKAPLFIIQGAKDPRVKENESTQMVKALRDRGIEVEYMLKQNEGHGFANEENRFEMYEAIEVFLAKHLKHSNTKKLALEKSLTGTK